MNLLSYLDSFCASFLIFLLNVVYTSASVEGLDLIQSLFNSRFIRATDIKTDVNVTSLEKQSNYSISTSKEKIDIKGKTKCFNETFIATNGTFYCPQSFEPKEWTACCGNKPRQYCCKPLPPHKDQKQDVTLDLITALSIVIGFIVAISCCLLLYCCCCQKRTGVHSGKLVWIKRKKSGNKTVYTTSDHPDIDEEQEGEGTELVGFMEQREDNDTAGSRRGSVVESKPNSRRASKASVDHKHDHHRSDHETNHSPVPVVKHVTPSGQVLMVPLINIQGSTPGTSPS